MVRLCVLFEPKTFFSLAKEIETPKKVPLKGFAEVLCSCFQLNAISFQC